MMKLTVTEICDNYSSGSKFMCVGTFKRFSTSVCFTENEVYETVDSPFGVQLETNLNKDGYSKVTVQTGDGATFKEV
jgi:hypothetical protein